MIPMKIDFIFYLTGWAQCGRCASSTPIRLQPVVGYRLGKRAVDNIHRRQGIWIICKFCARIVQVVEPNT